MNIIILGAGELGNYVAVKLAEEDYNVTLIDRDAHSLAKAASIGDVATHEGHGADWELFEELLELEPDAFFALSGEDATNLVACSLAKNLGYPLTVARLQQSDYSSSGRLDFSRLFYVDHFLNPDLLVAQSLYNTLVNRDFITVENLAHGSIQLRTIVIPSKWKHAEIKLKDLKLPRRVMIGLIYRGKHSSDERQTKLIFPHGEDCLKPHDEVTFVGDTRAILNLHQYIGMTIHPLKEVVIIGASPAAFHLVEILLEAGIKVKVIEREAAVCERLVDRYPQAVVINQDATKIDHLRAERIDRADACVICTAEDDVNLLVAILAKEVGCEDVIVGISDSSYIPVVERLGLMHVLSSRGIANNRLRTILKQENVASMVSLYENRAQVLEIKVSAGSPLIGIPISELGPKFPRDFLISAIHNQGKVTIADGRQTFSPGDTVVAICNPRLARDIARFF